MPVTARVLPINSSEMGQADSAAVPIGGPVAALHKHLENRLANTVWTIQEQPLAGAGGYGSIAVLAIAVLAVLGGGIGAALMLH